MSEHYFWEPTKAARVLAERGITLEEVPTVFEDEFLDIFPDLARLGAFGLRSALHCDGTSTQGRLLVVTFYGTR